MSVPSTDLRRKPERAGDAATVRAVLDEALVVHVGTVRDGWPVVLPMVHGRIGDLLYLHGSVAAGLFRDVRQGSKVCVTATLVDGLVLSRTARNHSMDYRSCVVYGEAVPAADPLAALEAVVDHHLPGRWAQLPPTTVAELADTGVWQLDLATASAKVRTGGPNDPPADAGDAVWTGVVPVRTVFGDPEPVAGATGPLPRTR